MKRILMSNGMKRFPTAVLVGLTFVIGQPVAAEAPPKNIAARVEAIPIQTLTISDEQFLKGDAGGKPTTIAGVLRIAQGTGRLPVVVFVSGSGGFNANARTPISETKPVSF
jgi:hypothetical protein